MTLNKKYRVILGLSLFVLISVASTSVPEGSHENLQILPKDITQADLDSVMNGFENALGVSCDFCHASDKKDPLALDFASDDKPEKQITRKMMKMTEMINKEFFDYTILYKGGEIMAVSCNTCHQGKPRPNEPGL